MMRGKVYINHLTLLLPDEFVDYNVHVKELYHENTDSNIYSRLLKLSNYGFNTVSTSFKDKGEATMVSACLGKLFEKIGKDEFTYIVHCSPTAVLGENQGLICGVGRQILNDHQLKDKIFIPLLGGCASLKPALDTASGLAVSTNSNVVLILSLHASTARKQSSINETNKSMVTAAPYALFGDTCIACIISPYALSSINYEVIDSKFNYCSEKWVAKAFVDQEMKLILNAETQRSMLKEYLIREILTSNEKHKIHKYFCHNQVPFVFNEIMKELDIPCEDAPEIVSKYGNLAFATSLVNLAVNDFMLYGIEKCTIGLFSAGEHTGVSDSTVILVRNEFINTI